MKNSVLKNIAQRQLFVALLIFSISHIKAQKWVENPATTGIVSNGGVSSIKIVDKNIIWAVPKSEGDTLKVMKTTNGGQNWRLINTPTQSGIGIDIQAIDSTTAWVNYAYFSNNVWSGAAIYKTIDGGQTWTKKLVSPAAAGGLRFFDKNNGVCFSDNIFAYTSDGGENWTVDSTSNRLSITEHNSYLARDMKGDTVWFGTTLGGIFRSTNKGRNWTIFSSGIPPYWYIWEMSFKDAKNGMLIGTKRSSPEDFLGLAKTSDGGETWQLIPTIPNDFIGSYGNVIASVPNGNTNTYVLGIDGFRNSTIAKSFITLDGGNTWSPFQKNINGISNGGVQFISSTEGWLSNALISSAYPTAMFKWDASNFFTPTTELALDNAPLSISPNPTTGNFAIDWKNIKDLVPQYIRVVDITGKVVFEKTDLDKTAQVQKIDLKSVANGLYFIQMDTDAGVLTRKVVIEK